MESFPGPHNYMRPPLPPSSMADHHHNQHPPPPPHPSSWYPPQFQYHPSHSPSPPPPQQHWGPPPPPPSDYIHGHPPYASHPNPPYPPHSYPNQYPPPQQRPHLPPPPLPPPPYSSTIQEWGNQNWVPHSGWEQQAHNNGEDWAAKARAWATAKNAMENHVQSQYPSMQTSESHYDENEQINVQYSTYQNYPVPAAPMDRQHVVNQVDPAVSSVNGYYAPDVNLSYGSSKDGKFGDTGAAYPEQDAFMTSSVHKQEVPSSYSSIPGQQLNGSGNNQLASVRTDPCDQPLQFTARFNHPMMSADPVNPAKVIDSVTHVQSLHPWTPPPISFQSVPPTFPSAVQLDPTISMGRPPVPSFHGDIYATTPMNSDRPKKAAVPNWLRDEIIKKKDTIVSFGSDHHKEDSESIDDEPVDKPFGKSDQADSKSIDSSRSTEEDEDEDYEEASRTAAINQEIKRVLTDVLLKVTSDLFDEIATRVLSEDDDSFEVKNDTNAQNQKQSKATKTKEVKSEKSSSGAASGGVLGLVNYASDDDDDESENGNKDIVEGQNCRIETSHTSPSPEKLNNASQLTDLVEQTSNKNGKVMERKTDSFDDSRDKDFIRKESNEPDMRKEDSREKEARRRDRHENRIESEEKHDEMHNKKKYEDLKERSNKQYDHKRQSSPHRHTKDNVRRKSERSDRSRHKHKRRRSSSNDSRDNSVPSFSDNSTDDASEKSKRKMHSKKRNLSPSPVRSRQRQVSQSPPSSKASKRRHSPYSSLEATRGRRSRSKSPARRRR